MLLDTKDVQLNNLTRGKYWIDNETLLLYVTINGCRRSPLAAYFDGTWQARSANDELSCDNCAIKYCNDFAQYEVMTAIGTAKNVQRA